MFYFTTTIIVVITQKIYIHDYTARKQYSEMSRCRQL